MTEVKALDKGQLDTLYRDYPSGRPLRFSTPAAPGGFSLVAAFSNFFEKLGLRERTPDWVQEACRKAQKEKVEDGTINGTTYMIVPGSGKIEMPNRGSLIRAAAREGDKRIALLLDLRPEQPPRGWLVAAWDGKTGQPYPLLV